MANRFDKYTQPPTAESPTSNRFDKYIPSKVESLARGAYSGVVQQPRDAIAATTAWFGGVPYQEALKAAQEMSMEGRQGEAQAAHPGYFTGGQVLGNVVSTAVPAAGVTKAIGQAAPTIAKLGMVGRTAAPIAESIGASRGLIGVPLYGAIQGAASTLQTQGDLSGAIPGAIGAGVVGAAGKLVRPIADDAISAARQGYTKVLKGIGINDLTPGQITGNKSLELADSVMNGLVSTAGASRKRIDGQLRKFTRAALSKAGIDADEITPAVRAAAEEGFNNRYQNIIANEVVKIDEPILKTIGEISAKQIDKLPTNVKPIVQSYMQDIVQSGGKLTGDAYQEARSNLSRQANSMVVSDPYTANILKTLRNSLDDAAERSLPEAKKGAWKQLNREYANYKTVQKAASSVSKDSLEGLLSPSALMSAVETANKSKGQKGYGELYNLARAGRSVLADNIPNSGTAERAAAQALLSGGGAYALTQDPETALGFGVGTLAAPKLAQMLLNSPAGRTYFTSGIPGLNRLATPEARSLSALLAGQAYGVQNK